MIMGYKSQRISTEHLESGIYRLCVAIYSVALWLAEYSSGEERGPWLSSGPKEFRVGITPPPAPGLVPGPGYSPGQSGTKSGRRSLVSPTRSHPLKPERRVPLRRDLGDRGVLKTAATGRGVKFCYDHFFLSAKALRW